MATDTTTAPAVLPTLRIVYSDNGSRPVKLSFLVDRLARLHVRLIPSLLELSPALGAYALDYGGIYTYVTNRVEHEDTFLELSLFEEYLNRHEECFEQAKALSLFALFDRMRRRVACACESKKRKDAVPYDFSRPVIDAAPSDAHGSLSCQFFVTRERGCFFLLRGALSKHLGDGKVLLEKYKARAFEANCRQSELFYPAPDAPTQAMRGLPVELLYELARERNDPKLEATADAIRSFGSRNCVMRLEGRMPAKAGANGLPDDWLPPPSRKVYPRQASTPAAMPSVTTAANHVNGSSHGVSAEASPPQVAVSGNYIESFPACSFNDESAAGPVQPSWQETLGWKLAGQPSPELAALQQQVQQLEEARGKLKTALASAQENLAVEMIAHNATLKRCTALHQLRDNEVKLFLASMGQPTQAQCWESLAEMKRGYEAERQAALHRNGAAAK